MHRGFGVLSDGCEHSCIGSSPPVHTHTALSDQFLQLQTSTHLEKLQHTQHLLQYYIKLGVLLNRTLAIQGVRYYIVNLKKMMLSVYCMIFALNLQRKYKIRFFMLPNNRIHFIKMSVCVCVCWHKEIKSFAIINRTQSMNTIEK